MDISIEQPMGSSHQTVVCLMQLAAYRLKPGGRLVFWLPTDGFLTQQNVRDILLELEADAGVTATKNTYDDNIERVFNYENTIHCQNDVSNVKYENESVQRVEESIIPSTSGSFSLSQDQNIWRNQLGGSAGGRLIFQRATPQELHDKLWRWLCVYTKEIL